MTEMEIWGCVDRYQAAGAESAEHLWGKIELDRRKDDQREPWFDGEYRFERRFADRVPDCYIAGGPVDRWIEIVAGSDQDYRAKTRETLRLGAVIHWVFQTEHRDQMQQARQELAPELEQPFRFGEYDPRAGMMDLGDPVTFKNYEFPVEEMAEFSRRAILGYRAGAAEMERTTEGFDLGLFNITGCQRRLFAFDPRGTCLRAVAPGQPIEDAPWGYPTKDGLERVVEAGGVTRLGPVGNGDGTVEWFS